MWGHLCPDPPSGQPAGTLKPLLFSKGQADCSRQLECPGITCCADGGASHAVPGSSLVKKSLERPRLGTWETISEALSLILETSSPTDGCRDSGAQTNGSRAEHPLPGRTQTGTTTQRNKNEPSCAGHTSVPHGGRAQEPGPPLRALSRTGEDTGISWKEKVLCHHLGKLFYNTGSGAYLRLPSRS